MNNRNLTHTLSVDELRKGGLRSAETRKRRKHMREAFETLGCMTFPDEKLGEIDGISLICWRQFERAMRGDTKAFIAIRDALGEMPVQKVESITIPDEVRERVEQALRGDE